MKVYGYIYKITNVIDEKVYIGQATIDFDTRYSGGLYNSASNKYFKEEIKRYGEGAFEVEKEFDANTKTEENEYKPRRFPTRIDREEINDEGEIIMNSIALLKKGRMNYVTYGYLQDISDGDKNDFDKFRKVYIKDINNSTIAKKCKGISRNTVTKAISRLEELGLLSLEIFKDENGEYKKLYNLDGNYEILDFGQKPIKKLVTCIKLEGLALFLIIRKYCRIYGKCTLTQEQLFEKLGYANNETSRKSMNLFLEVLEDIGCIRIERIKNEKKQNKNIYYSLV